MNDEISEEAKQALADLPRRKALQRLERDGATSRPAMQRRVLALAAERSIPPADYAKLMHKRVNDRAIHVFCKKYKVSYDWLLCGDLKGLQRMKHERVFQPVPAPAATAERLAEKYRNLPPELQKIVAKTIDGLLEQR
jgi:hypothetical protein